MKTSPTTFNPGINHPNASTRRGIIVMLLSVGGFTINTLLLSYLAGSGRPISPMLPLIFRAGVGAVIVLLFFRGSRPIVLKPVVTHPLLILRGVSGLLGTAAYYWTVPELGAGKSTLFCNTYVIFAALIAALFLGEKLSFQKWLWLALALGGIGLLTETSVTASGIQFGFSEGIALFGAVMAAWSVILIRQLVAHFSIGTIFLAQCVWIFVPVFPLVMHELPGLSFSDFALLTVAAVAAAYGQLAMNEGYRCLSVATGASLQMTWPVFASVGGFLFFSETFGFGQIIGGVLILASILRINTLRE